MFMMRNCDNCGRALHAEFDDGNMKYCPECGYRIQAAKAELDYWQTRKKIIQEKNEPLKKRTRKR